MADRPARQVGPLDPEPLPLAGAGEQQGGARHRQGRGGGDGRPRRPQPRAGDGEGQAQHRRPPGGVDEQEIEADVQQVGRRVEVQGGLGVAHAAEDGGEDLPGGHEGHGHGVEPQVGHRLGEHLRLRPQPPGDQAGQGLVEQQAQEAHHDGGQHPLADHPPGLFVVLRPDGVGDLDGVAHAHPHQQAVGQPDGGRVHRHGGGARRPQHPHHGGVHVADHGGEDLLNNRRPGQPPQGAQPALFLCLCFFWFFGLNSLFSSCRFLSLSRFFLLFWLLYLFLFNLLLFYLFFFFLFKPHIALSLFILNI